MSADKAPEETPTPATIRPTSPLDIIPIPTLIDLPLSFKKISAGRPHPANLVIIAIAIIIPDRYKTNCRVYEYYTRSIANII